MANLDTFDRLTRGPLRSRGADARVATLANEAVRVRPMLRSASPKRPAIEELESPSRSLSRATSSVNPRPPMVFVRERVVDRPTTRSRTQGEPRPEPSARRPAHERLIRVGVRASKRASERRTVERVERLRTIERIERIAKVVERVSSGPERRPAVPSPIRGTSRRSRPRQPGPVSTSRRPRALELVRPRPTRPQSSRLRAPLRPKRSSSSAIERRAGREQKAAASPTSSSDQQRAVVSARRIANEAPVVRVEARPRERVQASSERGRRPADVNARPLAASPSKRPRSEASVSATPRPPTEGHAPTQTRRDHAPTPTTKPAVRPQPARPTSARKSTSKPTPRQLGVRISIAHVEIRAQTRERKPSRTIAVAGPRAHSITPRLFGAV